MRYIVARMRFSSPLFLWRNRGKMSFKGVATSLKIPGTQAVWCSGYFCFTTTLSTIARTACGAEWYAKLSSDYLFKWYFLRMLQCKLALLIVETLTHFVLTQLHLVGGFGFHLYQSLYHLNTKTKILHKKVHGSGWNPAEPPQTRCKLWFNKKHQRNKSKLSIKINSAVVSLSLHRPCAFKDTTNEQSKKT